MCVCRGNIFIFDQISQLFISVRRFVWKASFRLGGGLVRLMNSRIGHKRFNDFGVVAARLRVLSELGKPASLDLIRVGCHNLRGFKTLTLWCIGV